MVYSDIKMKLLVYLGSGWRMKTKTRKSRDEFLHYDNTHMQTSVCRLHFIDTLKQELFNGTMAYEETSIDEKCVV